MGSRILSSDPFLYTQGYAALNFIVIIPRPMSGVAPPLKAAIVNVEVEAERVPDKFPTLPF